MIRRRAWARPGVTSLALALAVLVHPTPARSQGDATEVAIPKYEGYVTDAAGVMNDDERAKLEAFLDQVEKKTGAQLAVLTVKSTQPIDPMEYKVKVFEQWKIGKAGENNGLLMLVAMEERQVRFETGYGLEGTLPDGLQSRIVRERMRPLLRENRPGEAITQGMLACAAKIADEKGVALEWDGRELRYDGGDRPGPELIVVLIVAFIMFSIIAGRLRGYGGRRYRRGWYGPGGFGGWGGGFGGFGGGGFGGGGGGGSFGGFGGGSSGGGGGGGGW